MDEFTFSLLDIIIDEDGWCVSIANVSLNSEDNSRSLFEIGYAEGEFLFDVFWLGLLKG